MRGTKTCEWSAIAGEVPMSPFIIAIILSAALLHAVWNAIVKTAADRTTTLGLGIRPV